MQDVGLSAGHEQRDSGREGLAPFAVDLIRRCGGVLEHPARSSLWRHRLTAGDYLPRPGQRDVHGGFTFSAPQWWWGHRAEKWTWFYIVGCEPKDLPPLPYKIGRAERVITNQHRFKKDHPSFRREVTKRERDATPPELAAWLIAVVRRCRTPAK